MCKKFEFEFEYTIKWNLHKSGSVQENITHKVLWYFEIQNDVNKWNKLKIDKNLET